MSLSAVPLTRDEATRFVREHHRHHEPLPGYRYAFGAVRAGQLVGLAWCGRPCAGKLDQYHWLEVSRLCTDGSRNVCSFLYSRASRLARMLGFARVFTCILESESGASLKAAGWRYEYTTRGGSWNRKTRPRVDKAPTCPKQVWAPTWCSQEPTDAK